MTPAELIMLPVECVAGRFANGNLPRLWRVPLTRPRPGGSFLGRLTFALISLLAWGNASASAGEVALPTFRAVEIDAKVEIGYGIALADIDGDKKLDILLADKKQIVWYRNPTWEKFVIAENLTKLDNVCVAAADLDGDGKSEIAVGAGWNPGDTVNSGAVFYLIPPKDRTQKWEPVELPHEPTVHRMRWAKNNAGKFELIVAPLHGRGNKDGEGAGVKILSYKVPTNPRDPWKTDVVSDSLHMTHNFEIVNWNRQQSDEFLIASKEGVFHLVNEAGGWKSQQLAGNRAGESGFAGAGEVRVGKLPNSSPFIATIEPMHGNQLVTYTRPAGNDPGALWKRNVLDSSLKEGHAVACGDFLGMGSDQLVAGWRTKNADGKVGIKFFAPLDKEGKDWKQTIVDYDTMACEDLRVADLDGDGRLDIVASGRATKNLKIYFNTSAK